MQKTRVFKENKKKKKDIQQKRLHERALLDETNPLSNELDLRSTVDSCIAHAISCHIQPIR